MFERIFADRGSGWRVAVAVLALSAMGGGYAWWAITANVGFLNCLEDPTYDGTELVFPLWVVTRVDGPERYEISKVVRDVPVVGSSVGLAVGDTVSVVGQFTAGDRTVHETRRELHTLRKYKEALGILGFVFVSAAAPFCFRVQGRRLVERASQRSAD